MTDMVLEKVFGVFNSFQEALDYVSQPTHFERAYDIYMQEKKVLLDLPDIKFVAISKSDNTKSFFIFFKTSKVHEKWLFWCPSQEQMDILIHVLPGLMHVIDKQNGEKR